MPDINNPTAASLMTRSVVSILAETPVREIALLLAERSISAVPVVDSQGKCWAWSPRLIWFGVSRGWLIPSPAGWPGCSPTRRAGLSAMPAPMAPWRATS